MQTETTPLDTQARMRAIHAASVRLVRVHDARTRGERTRDLARQAQRQGRARMAVQPEIALALANLAARKDAIREALKDERYLRVNAHASAQGWHALYTAKLVRENPARTSWSTAELISRLRGIERELA